MPQNKMENFGVVYFLEKDFKITPTRPLFTALSKYCRLLCINPPISIDTLFRRPGTFINWLKKNKIEKYDELNVYTPFAFVSYGISDVIPLFKPINRFIVSRMVRRIIDKLSLKNIFWGITCPQQDYLLNFFGNDPVFYFIRDLIASLFSKRVFERMQKRENQIIKRVSIVFTTSENLYDLKKVHNPKTFYCPNGADINHFLNSKNKFEHMPDDIKCITKPKIGFAGNINELLDINLLNDIARAHSDWAIVLIGCINYDRSRNSDGFKNLLRLPNVHHLGVKKYDELPDYIKAFDVCVTPYVRCLWMEYSFPNKLVQYLAAGKPVVSTDYPATGLFKDVIRICKSNEEFIQSVERYINDGTEEVEVRKRIDIAKKYDVSRTALEKVKILESAAVKEDIVKV